MRESFPLPTLVRLAKLPPLMPPSTIRPETVVSVLRLPVVRELPPSWNRPAPSMEPTVRNAVFAPAFRQRKSTQSALETRFAQGSFLDCSTVALFQSQSPGVPLGPNPRVGCLLLAPDGTTLAEGLHRGAGTPHAEADALSRAGDRARGSTAVVTLEPCNHTGRTGPCAQALVDAGVARVVFAHDRAVWEP